ncbi:MAG: TIGR00730 family Rossman fold protein [Candidatus Thioglobus sp.]|nr:MAG: TIGR00730 family Rossman fold protein [Candidatus Thioglobus sp.]RUM80834.1 MAG: TIGR00730 family Rossman fold protein [Candidatus Thioglobus sp.]RUM83950.1 MAG: TIGR00730 family Rossman fold protein [Candidatus Thioglobus sp.]
MKIDVVESELNEAQTVLEKFDNNITIFGSSRIAQDDPLAQKAYQLGKSLSDAGFNVLTGAGPGIMQAANHGAFEGKSKSIGLNIKLPKEQSPNLYLDECLLFEHFFTRKVMLIKHADACVFFPGGFGTADELMEILTLVQTRKGKQIKILLFDSAFWTPLMNWFKTLENNQYINSTDLGSFELVDSVEQILETLEA